MNTFFITGKIIDIINKTIFNGKVSVNNGIIESITKVETADDHYILPGFIDAHVHVESSMLVPSEFARLAVVHGTVSTISDPHEIGNVLGVEGVKYMIDNGNQVNFKFYFGAPSCVPATPFETAGAEITPDDIDHLMQIDNIKYLAEMMNWPGVLENDPVVFKKIELAKKYGKKIDGHAPGLRGEKAKKYIAAGISTDHECFTREEALGKLKYGMKIIIREGSAAKNFNALIPLMHDHSDLMMFCSDDKHPDNLVEGHINLLVKRAIAEGIDIFKVLKAACINPIEHYGLNVGRLMSGDPADFILVDNLKDFNVKKTIIGGEIVAENGKTNIRSVTSKIINNFSINKREALDFKINYQSNHINVMEALDGQLITNKLKLPIKNNDGYLESDITTDILKLTVVNRYQDTKPAVAFIKNFGLKTGAIASSVAHDSHNIIAVGVDDISICKAINLIIEHRGGVSAVDAQKEMVVPLPVAGLMSTDNGYTVAKNYAAIDQMAKRMGSKLTSPYMTLSFMALLVIPSIKLSDKGLFDGENFDFIKLFET